MLLRSCRHIKTLKLSWLLFLEIDDTFHEMLSEAGCFCRGDDSIWIKLVTVADSSRHLLAEERDLCVQTTQTGLMSSQAIYSINQATPDFIFSLLLSLLLSLSRPRSRSPSLSLGRDLSWPDSCNGQDSRACHVYIAWVCTVCETAVWVALDPRAV